MPSTAAEAEIQVAAAVIVGHDGRILLARRPDHVHQGGLWEFPGGKLEPDESPCAALVRELSEELGIRVTRARPLIQVPHAYPDKRVRLQVWRVEAWAGEPHGREGQPLQWVEPDALPDLDFPAANRPIVTAARLPDRYLITPSPTDRAAFLTRLDALLDAGLRLIQLRAPGLPPAEWGALAEAVAERCARTGARLLLNRDIEGARRLGVGVHLSAAQLMQLEARPLPAGQWVGASCHDARELARAEALGADFAVLGPVRPTATHPEAIPLGWEALADRIAECTLPVYALGGMKPGDLDAAWAAGAQGIAAIRSLWGGD